MLYVRGFAYMFPDKEKIAKFFCFQSQKRITATDIAEQRKKNETFPAFMGHFHPKKSDDYICVEMSCAYTPGFSSKFIWL